MHLAHCTIKNGGKRIGFIFFLFFYLYMPMVCDINSVYLVGAVGCGFLLIYQCRIKQKILYTVAILVLESVYVLMLGFISTGKILNTVGGGVYLVIFILPAALSITYVAKRWQYGLDEIIESLAITAMIQAILSVFCYLFGGFRNLVIGDIGYDPSWSHRLFGYASDLLYSMPVLQAMIGTITLLYALMKQQKIIYMLMAVIIWLSGIINARTSFVVIVLGLGSIFSLIGKIPRKNIQRILIVAGGGISIGLYGLLCFGHKDNTMWLWDGLTELFTFVTKGQYEYGNGYFGTLFSPDFLKLPSGINFFFGTGQYPNSDVGFVRNLWRDGLFFTIIIYCILIHFIIRICKMVAQVYGKKIAGRIFAFSILTWLLINIKGEAFGISEFFNLIVLFYVLSFYIGSTAKQSMIETKTDRTAIIYEERMS